MLMPLNTNSLNSKALKGAKSDTQVDTNLLDALKIENAEDGEFATELMASLSAEELKVKPVEVSEDNALPMPSSLTNLPPTGQQEVVNPKVFDPAMTKGVEELIGPKTTATPTLPVENASVATLSNSEVLTLAKMSPEIQGKAVITDAEVIAIAEAQPQDMLAQMRAESRTGHSPVNGLAKSEIDPQLMNMEDFIAQKNIVTKKTMDTSGYGMPQTQKAQLENGLKPTQVVAEKGTIDAPGTQSVPMNSQQFLLGLSVERSASEAPKVSEVAAPQKSFEMSQIKTDNPNQIMTQITDYIVQAKAAKEPTVNMRVNHDELGMIDITVHKAGTAADAIAINIGTHSMEGRNFFQVNTKDLFSHLTQAGINVSDLKVETPSQTARNDFDMSNQSGRGNFGQDRQFNSEQNQRRHDSDRREQLWNLLRNKEAA